MLSLLSAGFALGVHAMHGPSAAVLRTQFSTKRITLPAPKPAALALAQLFQPLAIKPPGDIVEQAKQQVSEDTYECSYLWGRICASRSAFVEDPATHAKRKATATLSLWDLSASWNWCLPKDCADTPDLYAIGIFAQTHLFEIFDSSVVPEGMKASLTIDCSSNGGGFVYVDPDGR